MRSIKSILLISIIVVIVSVFLFQYFVSSTSTAAIVTVLEKGYSMEDGEAWIKIIPPNSPTEIQNEYKVTVKVKEPSIWNLIEKDQIYLVNYIEKHNIKTLDYIKKSGDNQAIP
ncbi:hypothetical protein CON21_03920 [Bacillus thuringiensis]|uniref:hypothetical protein n=1 Tax=Bacillus thuringiensis TaxID=1428 RepID=UPI000BEDD16D|nr:hypothetical protein [Bacillus thuringiensis]PEF02094.1 hypothetical protein CON21_03920 [Bacillus thuringiensis]